MAVIGTQRGRAEKRQQDRQQFPPPSGSSTPPPISANAHGQMVATGSNFNHRGIGKPRAKSAVMPEPSKKNISNKEQKRMGALTRRAQKGGVTPQEKRHIRRAGNRMAKSPLPNNGPSAGPTSALNRRNRDRNGNPLGINEYLSGDTTFKSQLADLARNMQNYREDYRANRQDVNEDFGRAMGSMGRERNRSYEEMRNDFSGRGLIHSGLYADSLRDYDKEFGFRKRELTDDRAEQQEDLLRNKKLFREEVRGVRRNARDEALRRRAARLGLGFGA